MTCPYPPSDPVCQTGPTTSTTIMRVSVVNQEGFYGPAQGIEASTQSVQKAVEHQTAVMVIGFTAVIIVIAIVGAMIAAAIKDSK